MSSAGLGRTSQYVLTGGIAVLFLFPLVWSAVASISAQPGTAQARGPGLQNYATLFSYGAGLPTYLLNSVIISSLTVVLTLGVSILGGYAFARFRFPGHDVLFLLTIAILMVPYGTLLIPLYVLLHAIGLQNSLLGVGLVLTLFQLPFAIFMMRISFGAVPRELEESALVDGAGSFAVLRRIFLPAVRPGVITVGLFAFLAAWNDFVTPLILISSDKQSPLPLAIASLRQQTSFTIDYGATEAGVIVMAVPCLILFIVLQRHYVRGFMSGAIKG
jgi:multiple sugar transport system permease protein